MKIHELAAACKAQANAEKEGDDLEFPFDADEEEGEANLTEALLQLEACWSLLDGLGEHFKSPRAKMNTFLRREIARVATDTANLLIQYNMTDLHEEDTDIIDVIPTRP